MFTLWDRFRALSGFFETAPTDPALTLWLASLNEAALGDMSRNVKKSAWVFWLFSVVLMFAPLMGAVFQFYALAGTDFLFVMAAIFIGFAGVACAVFLDALAKALRPISWTPALCLEALKYSKQSPQASAWGGQAVGAPRELRVFDLKFMQALRNQEAGSKACKALHRLS